jgi:hypothetical protein
MAGGEVMCIRSLRIWLALAVLMSIASCASYDCAYDTKNRPDPIYMTVEDGAFYGQNYKACFLINGVVQKEYIPECAYRYYYEKRSR